MTTIIKNAYVLTMDEKDTIYENGCVVINDEKIAFVGEESDYPTNGDEQIIDANGNIIMPGLVNAHTHLPMTIFKGYGEGLPLDRWLNEKIWPAEAKLDDDIVYWSSMLGLIEMAKTGTTAFLDMYYFYDAIAKAVKESGFRAVFARAVLDVDGGGEDRYNKSVEVFKKYHGVGNITAMLSAHAEYTNSPKMLERIGKEAENLECGIHIHISETSFEHEECKKRHGVTPIKLIDHLGLTKNHISAAHCVWVSDDDIDIMAKEDINVLSCPQSNLKLGSGIAPIKKMMDAGVNVGIGTDGSSSNNNLDMIEETMLLSLLQRGTCLDANAIKDLESLKMATVNSAKAIGLEGKVGVLEKDMTADLIMIDTDSIDFTPRNDLVSSVLNSGNGKNVCMTMIGGKVIYRDGEVLFADEVEVKKQVQKFADKILN